MNSFEQLNIHPENNLNVKTMQEKMRDPNFLPKYKEIEVYVKDANRHIEKRYKEWLDFFRGNPEKQIYEVWTEEYIEAFGNYLVQRVRDLGGSERSPIIILEVGAGNGRLTHFLQERLERLIPGQVKIIASDPGTSDSWKDKIDHDFPVENLSQQEALKKYKPQIVIGSWMPYGDDFTDDFRKTSSVEEYILIGPEHCTGNSWKTWGNPTNSEEDRELFPPYELDNFKKRRLEDLSELQISSLVFLEIGGEKTGTYSFKREREN
ncbi:hypothetical protein COU49_02605 [Candidatus Nomurabacteria bacterium CG10_big_fil_rev_8_21_14_0_10_35_16]|uniref:Histidine-specific methyltransferase SAM-dependent domain-containing protein n=1 Tax=Candidatus Nomurabacteria bacterium CG10_big_fil_rev_8_21_14_0_10_35_16 TaxID=1974731 RepID=A0A2H0TB03_9BACT|nr:MAG: hypothetical protein COU49_02605 [Candidatus Nomurabacteria bacterium CG10_big_fil_rev_8_21_14_0_10_35_16]